MSKIMELAIISQRKKRHPCIETNPDLRQLVLAPSLGVRHILGTMCEILPGIFTWGSTYADRPWDLDGYAITLEGMHPPR
jgi:hypothetical protein